LGRIDAEERNEVKAGKGADARQQNEGKLGGSGRGDIGRRNVSDDRKRELEMERTPLPRRLADEECWWWWKHFAASSVKD